MSRDAHSAGAATLQAPSARSSGVITLAGSGATLLGASAPWLLRVVFGVSVAASRLPDVIPAVMALTVLSAVIAIGVLLRRPASSPVALGLIALALAQLCLAAWNGLSVLQVLNMDGSRLVGGRAIGTGVYLGLLGASLTLTGGILAWRRRAARSGILVNVQ